MTHPDEATWEQLAHGELDAPTRDAWFDHILDCEACTEVWRGLTMLRNDAQVQGLIPPPAITRHWLRSPVIQLALAATLLLAVSGIVLTRRTVDTTALRGGQAAAVGELSAAVGADGARFAWSPIAAATTYRISVFTADGLPVWEQEVAAPPARWVEMPRAAVSYKWRVEALAAGTVIARSQLADLEAVP